MRKSVCVSMFANFVIVSVIVAAGISIAVSVKITITNLGICYFVE